MSKPRAVSIIVPTFNESENVTPLVSRIDKSFSKTNVDYEIVFVDDRSQDGTQKKIDQLLNRRVRMLTKKGERGKATSLLQGFDEAKYDTICMIDADLQYPPEEIVMMYELMETNKADLIVTQRQDNKTGKLRQLSTKTFNFVFTRMLFGFNYDSQSGLKLFKKKVINSAKLNPTPWSFDLEFIVRALENNFKILNHSITFSERNAGEAKVKIFRVTLELIKASVSLRRNSSSKKVKQGYENNVKFSRKAYSGFSGFAVIVTGLVLLMGASSPPLNAAEDDSQIPLSSAARYPLDNLPNDDNKQPSQPVITTPVQPELQPQTNPNSTFTNSTRQTTSSTQQPVLRNTTPATMKPASVTPSTTSPQQQQPIAKSQPASQPANAVLAQATYPNYAAQAAQSNQYNSKESSNNNGGDVFKVLGSVAAGFGAIALATSQSLRQLLPFNRHG